MSPPEPTTDPWTELLEAAREVHDRLGHQRDCRLCVALRAFIDAPTLFDDPAPEPPPFDASAVDRRDIGGFRSTDPATSREAAVALYPRSGTQRQRVFAVVLEAGFAGATVSDVISQTGLLHQSASTRLSELKRGGWVVASGEREGELGVMQTVLVATPKAVEESLRRHDAEQPQLQAEAA